MKDKLASDGIYRLAVIGLASIIGVLLFLLLFPKEPDTVDTAKFRKQQASLRDKTADAKAATDLLVAQNQKLLWTMDAQRVGAVALQEITREAKARGLKLISFRPQKADLIGNIEALPFLAIVEGRFPAVASLQAYLERPGTKLAANLFQVTSTNDSGDLVTSNIGLVAFRDVRKSKETSNGKD